MSEIFFTSEAVDVSASAAFDFFRRGEDFLCVDATGALKDEDIGIETLLETCTPPETARETWTELPLDERTALFA